MVELKNIVWNNDQITCDIYPEASEHPGKLVCDGKTGELVSFELPEGYEYCRNHARHAAREIGDMKAKGDLSTSRLVMWY